jgi:hypothetical protein
MQRDSPVRRRATREGAAAFRRFPTIRNRELGRSIRALVASVEETCCYN